MKKLTLTLAAVACVGLATPAFASGVSGTQSAPQLTRADAGQVTDLSAATKKKKKSTTARKSWGGS